MKPSKPTTNRVKIRQALSKLGRGYLLVATTLKSKRIRGYQGRMEACPITVYLKRTTKLDCQVYWRIIWNEGDASKGIFTPRVISRFISAFDAGQFPELIQKPRLKK